MNRNKRTQFWGRDPDDDLLVREVIAGEKTATVDLAYQNHLPMGDFDDGDLEAGDLVDVYDNREGLRCRILVTEVHPVRFGRIPERLWRAENCRDEQHFVAAHHECWPDENLNEDTELIATYFELVEVVAP